MLFQSDEQSAQEAMPPALQHGKVRRLVSASVPAFCLLARALAFVDPAGDDPVRVSKPAGDLEPGGHTKGVGKGLLKLGRHLGRRRNRKTWGDRHLRPDPGTDCRQLRLHDLLAGRLAGPVAAWRIGDVKAPADFGQTIARQSVLSRETGHWGGPDERIELLPAEGDGLVCFGISHVIGSYCWVIFAAVRDVKESNSERAGGHASWQVRKPDGFG
jgi:hypothetical protein